MNESKFEIPHGWQIQGAPPAVDGQPGLLTEDLFSVCAPGAVLTLDVGWKPVGDPKGRFVCALVVEDEWDAPLQTLVTKDPREVHAWIVAALDVMQQMAGTESVQPSAVVEELIDFGEAPTLTRDLRDRRAA